MQSEFHQQSDRISSILRKNQSQVRGVVSQFLKSLKLSKIFEMRPAVMPNKFAANCLKDLDSHESDSMSGNVENSFVVIFFCLIT